MATLMLSVMGAFAEFERALIKERQREGIALAKQKGVYKGRKPALDEVKLRTISTQLASGVPKARVARDYGISTVALYRYLRNIPSSMV